MLKVIATFLSAVLLAGCAGLNPTAIEGTIKIQLSEETVAWRAQQKKLRLGANAKVKTRKIKKKNGEEETVLIRGTPVDRAKFPAIIRIVSASGAGCTATLVGPQVILTAAHCGDPGEAFQFTAFDGKKYQGQFYPYENWSKADDMDLSIGKLTTPVTGITPLAIETVRFETARNADKKGTVLSLFGYGCINPGGGPNGMGNDGILRTGFAEVTGADGYDLVLIDEPSALCSGDSGGPVLYNGKVSAVNSKGDLNHQSWVTRTTGPVVPNKMLPQTWFENTAKKLDVTIAGIGAGTHPPPPVPPSGPTQGTYEDARIKFQWLIK